ncbi:hypothetical protein ACTHHL_19165 [Aeribacillus composti]|uniref:hypothetical protein n=1 Tax=Aeribacillus composti TaxID=1868734 RepID=UPI00406A96ED
MRAAWIKWKIYIRWKNQWSKFLNRRGYSGYIFAIIAFFLDVIEAIFYFFSAYAVLKLVIMNEFLHTATTGAPFLDFLLQKISQINNNVYILWQFYFVYVIVFSVIAGIKASKWNLSSMDKEWLLSHFKLSLSKANSMVIFETICWNIRSFIIHILTLLFSLSYAIGLNISMVIGLTLLSFSLYLFVSIAVSFSHTFYVYKFIIEKPFVNKVAKIVISRMIIFSIGYFFAAKFTGWLIDIPFIKENPTSESFEKWSNKGWEILFDSVTTIKINLSFFDIFTADSLYTYIGTILMCMFTMVFYLLFIILFKENPNRRSAEYFDRLPSPLLKVPFLKKKAFTILLFIRSSFFQKRLPYMFGDFVYWFSVGIFSGLLANLDDEYKVQQLVLSFFILYHIYFLAERHYQHFIGGMALESDGTNVLIYLNAGKNLWYVFKQKFFVYIITLIPLIIIGDFIVYILTPISLTTIIWLLSMQILALNAFGALNYISSAFYPHFEFRNAEELNEFGDKKMVDSILDAMSLFIILPSMTIPMVLFIMGYLTKSQYLFINPIFLAIYLFGMLFISLLLVKRKLNKKQFIY